MMTEGDLHELAAAYAVDALDHDEVTAFELHLTSCSMCETTVAGFVETAATLAGSFNTPPPAELRSRVMSHVMTTRQDSPRAGGVVVDLRQERESRRRHVILATSVAAALALIIGITSLVVSGSPTTDRTTEIASVLVAPDVEVTPLLGSNGVDGSVSVAWSEQVGRYVLLADGLADLPRNRVYELWFIDNAGPVNAGLFDNNAGEVLEISGSLVGDPSAWAVTIEPEGGSETPTTDPIFVGEVVNS